ncbi:MAG: outer membrane beta-barrel protein [Woeseiaceae bacterium]|nr:outer membrane beta-barrel protein [Woeseiaceae bacterium]
MKRTFIAILMLFFSLPASAQWVAGGGYAQFSDSDINLGGIYGSIGYVVHEHEGLTIMPEFRLGIGVDPDTVAGIDVELDRFLAISVRGEYALVEDFYVYLAPSYAHVDLTASSFGFTVSEDDWEFGFGGGFGYRISEALAGELSWESFDGTDVIGLGLRYSFD